jgi:hypothetical protein
MKLENWYKTIVESNTEIPPESVWSNIQDNLDVELVWDRVSSKLAISRKKKLLVVFAMAASILLIISITGYLLFFSTNRMEKIQIVQNENALDFKSEEIPNIRNTQDPIQHSGKEPATLTIKIYNEESEKNEIYFNSNPTDYEQVTLENYLNPIASIQTFKFQVQKQIDKFSLDVKNQFFAEDFKESRSSFTNFYIGLSGQIANTWLLNSKTIEGLKKTEFTATNPSFGKNVGILLGTNLTKRLDLKAHFFWISQTNQSYNEYINGLYVSNNLELNYYTACFLFKYKVMKNSGKHNVLFGGYSGFIQNATQSIDGTKTVILDEYNNVDYGLVIGYEYPVQLNKRITLSTGVITKIGLSNIFTGNEIIPSYLNKTQNASVNLSFSLNYSFF